MADKKPILPTPAEKGVKRGGADGDSSMLSSSPPRHSHDNGRGEGGRDGKHGKDGAKGEGHKPRRNSFDADHGVFAPAKAVGRRNQRTDKTPEVGKELEWSGRYTKDQLIALSRWQSLSANVLAVRYLGTDAADGPNRCSAAMKRPPDIPSLFIRDQPGNLADKAKEERVAKKREEKDRDKDRREGGGRRESQQEVGVGRGRGRGQPGDMLQGGDGILSGGRGMAPQTVCKLSAACGSSLLCGKGVAVCGCRQSAMFPDSHTST
eukprot:3743379-Rhodomonas_salina.1